MILKMELKILEARYKDGSTFKASDDFVCCWARREMNWAQHKSTQAVQKIPNRAITYPQSIFDKRIQYLLTSLR